MTSLLRCGLFLQEYTTHLLRTHGPSLSRPPISFEFCPAKPPTTKTMKAAAAAAACNAYFEAVQERRVVYGKSHGELQHEESCEVDTCMCCLVSSHASEEACLSKVTQRISRLRSMSC